METEKEIKEDKEVKFRLPKKGSPESLVVIKPNYNNPGGLTRNPKHKAFFLMDGASKGFMTPLRRDGGLVNVLTDEEKDYLEGILYMKDNELSIYKKPEENFWLNRVVRLTKDPLRLDLSDPMQYIDYKILLANKELIAPSIKSVKDKATYKFYIERKVDKDVIEQEKASLNTEVWTTFAEVTRNKEDIINMLKAYAVSYPKYASYRNVSEEHDLKFLQGQLGTIVAESPKDFLALANDPLLEARVLISRCLEKGLLERKGQKYFIKNDPNSIGGDLKSTCNYIMADRNQELKMTLEEKLKVVND